MIKRVDKKVHDALYKQLEFLDNFFTQHKKNYWIIGGTLLGAWREKAIIPHDDDADIGIFKDDMEFVAEKLKPLANANGYQFWNAYYGFKIVQKIDNSNIGTDIFVYKLKLERFVLSSKEARTKWPNDYFLKSELGKMCRIKFGDLQLSSVADPNRYLSMLYGDDYMTVIYLLFNHVENKMHDGHHKKIAISQITYT